MRVEITIAPLRELLRSPGTGLSSHQVALTVVSALRRFTTVFGTGTGGPTAHYCTRTYACSPINRIPAGRVRLQGANDESGTARAGRAGLRGGDGVRPRRRWARATKRLGVAARKEQHV